MGVVTGQFQLPNASPAANALYQWKLSGDAIAYSVTSACICPVLFTGNLDTSGNMTATFLFNDVLSTSAGLTTNYQLTVKASGGGQIWNESYYLTGTAVNLNTYPPGGSGTGSGGGGGFVGGVWAYAGDVISLDGSGIFAQAQTVTPGGAMTLSVGGAVLDDGNGNALHLGGVENFNLSNDTGQGAGFVNTSGNTAKLFGNPLSVGFFETPGIVNGMVATSPTCTFGNYASSTALTTGLIVTPGSGTFVGNLNVTGTLSAAAFLPNRTGLIQYNFAGGGSAISAGAIGNVVIPVGMTVTGWEVLGDRSGTATVAVLACSYANFPASLASITSTDVPHVTGGQASANFAVSVWSPNLAATSVVQFSVSAISTIQTLAVGLIMSIPYA